MNRTLIFLFYFSLFSILLGSAQERRFSHFGLPEGLPQETIRSLDSDDKGFLWFGTSDGLVRYDGIDFFIPPKDPFSLLDLSGWRTGVVLAYDNKILVGTGQKGLLKYDTEEETTQALGVPNSNCTTIVIVPQGVLAGYYKNGISLIDDTGNSKELTFQIEFPKNITSIVSDNGKVYIGTDLGELFWFYEKDLDKEIEIKLTQINTSINSINRLVVIDDRVYMCTDNGIFQFNTITGVLPEFSIVNSENIKFQLNVKDLVKHHDTYFIGTESGLLETKLNKKSNTFLSQFHYRSGIKYDPFSLNRDNINDIHIHDDVLIIGHNSLDITQLDQLEVFESIIAPFNLGNPSVFSILDIKEELWVGTTSGVLALDKKTNEYVLFPEFKTKTVLNDIHGNIWIGTVDGIYIIKKKEFDFSSPSYIKVPSSEENDGLPNTNIRSLYKDRQGEIWVVTFNRGIHRFTGNIETDIFTFDHFAYQEESHELPSPFTIGMTQDHIGDYWITTQNGLSRMRFNTSHFNDPEFTTYLEEDGLITNGVLSSFVDSEEVLWVASRKGLNKYVREEDRFISYGKRDGLTNAFVYNILEEDSTYLWLSTNGGLFRFNKSSEKFTNYTPKDGVQSTEFNLGSAFKNEVTNELYFGGINGLNRFDPRKISELDKASDMVLTNFSIKDEHQSLPSKNSMNEGLSSMYKLELNYDDFPINLSFSPLDFRPNSNITYVYRLLPDSEKWNALNDKNKLQLLNLSPKKYTLEVQGMSRGTRWENAPLAMELLVSPPWYKSSWAYLCYFLLFFGSVFLIYKNSIRQKLATQETKRLQDLDDLKSRFITNITHEFRTPLTIILGYLDTLKERFNGKEEVQSSLETIEQNSNNLLGLVNQMLDLAKLEQGKLDIKYVQNDLVEFVRHITNSFFSIASEKGINLQFESSVQELLMDFDPEKLRQIVTNLLGNALKFSSEGSQVKVITSEEKGQVKIAVIDEGQGISEGELEHIFDRFFQVSDDDFKVSQGTGIGLALTKELVDLLDGEIYVESKLKVGSNFAVLLPIRNEAQIEKPQFKDIKASIGETVVPELHIEEVGQEANSILIVEDNVDMARYIKSCLVSNYSLLHAMDGAKGLEIAIREIPDLIISDVMMPVMDGFEMTKSLQENEATSHIPIVMLTSKAMQEDKLEGISSGADAYLTKPFNKKELQVRIEMLIAKRRKLQKRYQVAQIVNEPEPTVTTSDKNLVFLNRAISVIHGHLEDATFNAGELAKELALSDSQLYRKLKAINNTSTAIFIRKVRLEKAKELLLQTDNTISEVAYSTGFNDPNWFSKAFKEEMGQSPTQFRN